MDAAGPNVKCLAFSREFIFLRMRLWRSAGRSERWLHSRESGGPRRKATFTETQHLRCILIHAKTHQSQAGAAKMHNQQQKFSVSFWRASQFENMFEECELAFPALLFCYLRLPVWRFKFRFIIFRSQLLPIAWSFTGAPCLWGGVLCGPNYRSSLLSWPFSSPISLLNIT